MSRVGPVALLLLAAAAWGSATTLSDFALQGLPAVDLLALELTVGAAVVAGPVLARNRDALGTPGRGGFLLLGLFEPGLTFLLGNEGLRRASAATGIVTSLQLLAALAFALPLVIVVHLTSHDPLPAAGPGHWLSGAAAGLLGVALPFLLYNRAIAAVPAASAAGLLALIPLVGLATAVAFLGDRPAIGELIGGALILVSIVWIGTLTAGARDDAARPVPSAPPGRRPPGSPAPAAIWADAHS